MNENKCPHCGEDMVWSGDMLTGGLVCKTDHYAEAGYDGEGYTAAENAAIRKAFENAFGTPGYAQDPDAEQVCTDYVNDRLNLQSRQTGKTTKMLTRAAQSLGGCCVVVHSHTMKHYCARILIDKCGCRYRSRYNYILAKPDNTELRIFEVGEANYSLIGTPRTPVFVDHAVRTQARINYV